MNQDYNGSNNYQSLNTTNTEIQKQVGKKAPPSNNNSQKNKIV